MARPKSHLAVRVGESDLTRSDDGPARPGHLVHRDYLGNWQWPKPWHLICAQVAIWVGWTPEQTMRAPVGVIGHIYAAHQRSDDG